MRVIRANAAGACYGVQRALDMAAQAAAEYDDVKSLGPLIHNPQVVAELAKRGMAVVDEAAEDLTGTVIIRSHGVGPAARAKLDDLGVTVVDATCPHVLRAQQAASKLAREHGFVVVIGDPHHPEVDAIRGYAELAGGEVCIVDAPESVPAKLPAKVGVVVQTTQNRTVFDAIIRALEDIGAELDVKDTICSATTKRQDAARSLASTVDAMVIIGGHNSSNTTRLYEICHEICPKAYHIESIEELDPADFSGCATVGITAGASTPESQIVPVERFLERL